MFQTVEGLFENKLTLCLGRFQWKFHNTNEIERIREDKDKDPCPMFRICANCDINQWNNGKVPHKDLHYEQKYKDSAVDLRTDQTVSQIPNIVFVVHELSLLYRLEFLRLL